MWLAVQLAALRRWVIYEDHRFTVTKPFDIQYDAGLDLAGTTSSAGALGLDDPGPRRGDLEDEVMASPSVTAE